MIAPLLAVGLMQEKTGMPIRSRLVMSATRVMPAGGDFWLYAGEGLFKGDGTLGLVVVGLPAGLELHGVTRNPAHLPDGPCIGVWRGPEGYIQYKKVERAWVYTCSVAGKQENPAHRLPFIHNHTRAPRRDRSTVEDMIVCWVLLSLRRPGQGFPGKYWGIETARQMSLPIGMTSEIICRKRLC